MNGWQVTASTLNSLFYLCFTAVRLKMYPSDEINNNFNDLLDHDSGKFFLKENIVRVDKAKKLVYFRNGDNCRR